MHSEIWRGEVDETKRRLKKTKVRAARNKGGLPTSAPAWVAAPSDTRRAADSRKIFDNIDIIGISLDINGYRMEMKDTMKLGIVSN